VRAASYLLPKRGMTISIGKPEALKANLSGFWSRRIDDVNRLVYKAQENQINIVSCLFMK
jgi:Txe/YoeB family toxin of toxin-antitoxin system